MFHGKPRLVDLAWLFKGKGDRISHHGSGLDDWMRDDWNEHNHTGAIA